MPLFEKEASFESIEKTANGIMASRLQNASRKCQEDLDNAGMSAMYGSRPHNIEYARAFADYIDAVSRIIIYSYQHALEGLGVAKPSKKLATEIRTAVTETMDRFLEGHRKQVEAFATKTGESWPWNNTESAIHVARAYVDGQLELIQHAPRSSPTATAGVPPVKDKGVIALKWKILGAVGVTLLSAGGYAINKLYIEPIAEARHQRLESRRELQKLIFPMVDSIMMFGDSVQFTARKQPEEFDHVVAAFRRGQESFLTSGPALSTAIDALFGHQLANEYVVLTDSTLNVLQMAVEHLAGDMSPSQHKSQAVKDSSAHKVLTVLNDWSKRAQQFKRGFAKAVIRAE